MHNFLKNHATIIRYFVSIVLPAMGGWLALNSQILEEYASAQKLAIAGVVLLVLAWRLAPPTRLYAYGLLLSWHLGAGSAIPWGWAAFFENDWGWLVFLVWAALCALPALLIPSRWFRFALAPSALLAALSPIGMFNPLMATAAFFPGWEWIGVLAAIALLLLPAVKNNKGFALLGVGLVFLGSVLNDLRDNADQIQLSAQAWAVETRFGGRAVDADRWLSRQAQLSNQVDDALEEGARLIITPEGSVDSWEVAAKAFWAGSTRDAAQKHGASVLLGAYRQIPDQQEWQSGLFDLGQDIFYPAAITLPGPMWHPWNADQHMPFDFSSEALRTRIQTPFGQAAYVICYEEMLLWPLAIRMIGPKPDLLLSSANQWFTTPITAAAQKRSFEIQQRIWGVPALRSVNLPG